MLWLLRQFIGMFLDTNLPVLHSKLDLLHEMLEDLHEVCMLDFFPAPSSHPTLLIVEG